MDGWKHCHEHRTNRAGLQLQGCPAIRRNDRGMGRYRHGRRGLDRLAAGLAANESGLALDHIRPASPLAYQPGDFRFRWQRAVRCELLRSTAYMSGAVVFRQARGVYLLGLAIGDRDHADQPAAGLYHDEGICRNRVQWRRVDDHCLGRLRYRFLRQRDQTQDLTYLCRQLVLWGLHRGHRPTARGQPHVDPGGLVQVLPYVWRRYRCHGAVVVWAQRCGLLSDHRVSRDDVLLRAQAGRTAGVFLSVVDRPLLGTDHPVHLGGSASLALHRLAGLGAIAGHGHVDHPPGAKLGRHDQRHDDPLRLLA